MERTNPRALEADWSEYDKRSPLKYVTSAELAKILGVHLQTINNWTTRKIIHPAPKAERTKLRGNKNYFKICTFRAWLEGKSEEEVMLDWLRKYWDIHDATPSQALHLCQALKEPYNLTYSLK